MVLPDLQVMLSPGRVPPMELRVWYAMSGTDMDLSTRVLAVRCPTILLGCYWTSGTAIWLCYAKSGTDQGSAVPDTFALPFLVSASLCALDEEVPSYAMSGTDIRRPKPFLCHVRYLHTPSYAFPMPFPVLTYAVLRLSYAMSGTDIRRPTPFLCDTGY
eukprot:3941722-Rhodomonas_salina.1